MPSAFCHSVCLYTSLSVSLFLSIWSGAVPKNTRNIKAIVDETAPTKMRHRAPALLCVSTPFCLRVSTDPVWSEAFYSQRCTIGWRAGCVLFDGWAGSWIRVHCVRCGQDATRGWSTIQRMACVNTTTKYDGEPTPRLRPMRPAVFHKVQSGQTQKGRLHATP